MSAPFVPTHEWQDVPDGAVLPPGCKIQVDITTGRKQARRLNGAATARQIDAEIPAIADLAALGARFVTWRYELGENGKPTKVPYRVFGDCKAATDKPVSWGTFAEARDALEARTDRDGVGFVPRPAEDGIIVVDLDGCIDPTSGEIADWGQQTVDNLNSYTEISPSGTGLKVFARVAPVPRFTRKTKTVEGVPKLSDKEPQIEVLGIGNRFTTLTGEHFGGMPLEIRDATDALVDLAEWMARAPGGSTANGHERKSPWPSDLLMRAAETIPNDDLPWDEWNNTAMRFWAASNGSNEGLAAFEAFSAGSDKYDAPTTDNRWSGITASPPTQYNENSLLIHARKFDENFPDPFRQAPPDSDFPGSKSLGAQQVCSSAGSQSAWPEPAPLFAEHEKPEPYPVDALPPSCALPSRHTRHSVSSRSS